MFLEQQGKNFVFNPFVTIWPEGYDNVEFSHYTLTPSTTI